MANDSDDKKQTRTQKAVTSAGKAMRNYGMRMSEDAAAQSASRADEPSPNSQPRYVNMDSYKRGGTVRKSGKARLHKGEKVVRRGKKSKRMRGRL